MELGTKIKRLRLQKNLTQEELADRCELTKGYISQLENELTSPSITTLEDILNALGTTFADFFKDEKEEKVVFTDAEFIEKIDATHKIEWLEGEEFGYVLAGRVWLHIGQAAYCVKKGEVFYFSSSKVHHLENRTGEKAVVLWIASPPTF